MVVEFIKGLPPAVGGVCFKLEVIEIPSQSKMLTLLPTQYLEAGSGKYIFSLIYKTICASANNRVLSERLDRSRSSFALDKFVSRQLFIAILNSDK